MTYSKREAPILVPIEHSLCAELGLDRSELHKRAVKEFYNRRQQSTLNLIWGRYGKDNQYQRCPLPDACRCRQTLEDETRWLGEGTGSGGVFKQEQKEMKRQLKRFRERQQISHLCRTPLESTSALAFLCLRTDRNPFHKRPLPWLDCCSCPCRSFLTLDKA